MPSGPVRVRTGRDAAWHTLRTEKTVVGSRPTACRHQTGCSTEVTRLTAQLLQTAISGFLILCMTLKSRASSILSHYGDVCKRFHTQKEEISDVFCAPASDHGNSFSNANRYPRACAASMKSDRMETLVSDTACSRYTAPGWSSETICCNAAAGSGCSVVIQSR